MDYRQLYEDLKRKHKKKTPPVTIDDVMEVSGTESKGVAHFYLERLEALGLIRRVPTGNGKKGVWFLNDR